MKLSKLEAYLLDEAIDDAYGFWEMVAENNRLEELEITCTKQEIRETLMGFVERGLMKVVKGDLGKSKFRELETEDALKAMEKDENWLWPPNLKDVYALYTTEKGEGLIQKDRKYYQSLFEEG